MTSNSSPRHFSIAALALALVLAACGADEEVTAANIATDESVETTVETTVADESEDEDHDGEEDHADEEDHDDHGDEEDHDDHGDDEDHGDEDHDDEHDHDDDASGLGAHEHGTAEMTMAWVDGDVAIDLISPTFNVFGFEYEPETDEDIAISEEQTEALSADGIITINDEAGCTLTEPLSTEVDREGSHSEITASWLLTCDNPDEINLLDASALFDAFPNFEDIDVEWLSPTEQSSGELTPGAPTLQLEG